MIAKIPDKRRDGGSNFAELIAYMIERDADKDTSHLELEQLERRRYDEILEAARSYLRATDDNLAAIERLEAIDAAAVRRRVAGPGQLVDSAGAWHGPHAVIGGIEHDDSHQGRLAAAQSYLAAAAEHLEQFGPLDGFFLARARARRASIAFHVVAQRGQSSQEEREALDDLLSGRLVGDALRVRTSSGGVCQHNCLTLATAAAEMDAVAVQNTRVKDALYHAIRAVGMGEHQYVFAIHRDTGNVHLHIAVNRVHPDTFKAVYPDRDYYKLDYAMRELELRFGWKHDPGPYAVHQRGGKPVIDWTSNRPNTKGKIPTAARDMEVHADHESLFSYARAAPLVTIKAALENPALTWSQLHQALAKHGLEIREKGQGFAIYDRLDPLTTPIKASDMHEQLSKSRLVKRLGPFEAPLPPVPAEAHYDKYRPPKRDPHMREVRREVRAKGRKSLRERYVRYRHAFIYRRLDPAGVRARFQTLRDEARKRRSIVRSSIPEAAQRRLLYSVIAFETMVAKDRLKREVRVERASLHADPTNRRLNYRQWVAQQAMGGDEAAIVQLNGWRYSSGRQILAVIKDAGGGDGIRAIELSDPKVAQLQHGIGFHVRVDGAIVYRRDEDATGFIDHGPFLQVTAPADTEILLEALRYAVEKFGGAFELTGSEAFKARAIKLLAEARVQVVLTSKPQEAELREARQQERIGRRTHRLR